MKTKEIVNKIFKEMNEGKQETAVTFNMKTFGMKIAQEIRQQTRKACFKEAQEIVLDYIGEINHDKIKFVDDRLKCGICKIGDDICKRLEKEVQKE
jgi:hypothetical protein